MRMAIKLDQIPKFLLSLGFRHMTSLISRYSLIFLEEMYTLFFSLDYINRNE